jgi:hypothetical protein
LSEELFSPADLRELAERGVSSERAAAQIEILRHPPSSLALVRPCTIGDGITRLSEEEEERFAAAGSQAAAEGRVTKFVPASGAATRMFKDLIAALEDDSKAEGARRFFDRLDDFPFASELKQRAGIDSSRSAPEERKLLGVLLREMGFISRPKGLIPFHRSERGARTAFEEQLREACAYARSSDGSCRVHFTVSAEHQDEFELELKRLKPAFSESGCRLAVTFSIQHPSTDTLAIDRDGNPFRSSNGQLLFRPGGHGALIRNLGALDGEIISIKNIDNILPAERNELSVRWKRIVIGVLADVQKEVTRALKRLDDSDDGDAPDNALQLLSARFRRTPSVALSSVDEKRDFARNALERPLRVVGVVKNEGEPGGAPFWTRNADGVVSVQIVESSQVDMGNAEQKKIWESSTHFNPVDIVCTLRDSKGEPFDLERFIDRRAVFVSKKSHEGRELSALELPGLWNGAMAEWNTLAVEVPAETFAPVKTVFDLLRPQHQPEGNDRE